MSFEAGGLGSGPARPGLFRLFDLAVESDLDLPAALGGASPPAEIAFRLRLEAAGLPEIEGATSTYRSPHVDGEGNVRLRAATASGHDLLRFGERLQFAIGDGEIACHFTPAVEAREIEILLLGTVLAYWLERRGTCCIHSSAVVTPGGSLGFLAGNGGGKSALAASFLQAGFPLLTDDILAIDRREGRFFGRGSYPQMRFWPADAERWTGRADPRDRVHPTVPKIRVAVGERGFGAFHAPASPLAALYLPVRRPGPEGGIEIEPVRPRDAAIELVRESFVAHLVASAPWARDRLARLAAIAAAVPLRRLSYPSGFERLPEVRSALLEDLSGLADESAEGGYG